MNLSATVCATNHIAAGPSHPGENKTVLGLRGYCSHLIYKVEYHNVALLLHCRIIGYKGAIQGLTGSLNNVIFDVYECPGLSEIFCSSVFDEGEE